ncbi:MAG: class I SAM-dependent methyltransferase [Hyphomicrobiaceae bacterium]|nr:class I SAM-dependent methyltransferase [Hyphomicrobiaceae bacterium]
MSSCDERRALKASWPSTVLEERHTRTCKVLPSRMHLLDQLPQDGVVAEIGVAFGDFTNRIMERNKPRKLHLVDAWETERFRAGLEQLRGRFADEISNGAIEINQGLSIERMTEFPDGYFDWVYIDTDHSYPTTREELHLAARKVKPGGYIAGHDFTSGNPVRAVPYGVIEACNEFCVDESWSYAFLTLEPSGHFSFALLELAEEGT